MYHLGDIKRIYHERCPCHGSRINRLEDWGAQERNWTIFCVCFHAALIVFLKLLCDCCRTAGFRVEALLTLRLTCFAPLRNLRAIKDEWVMSRHMAVHAFGTHFYIFGCARRKVSCPAFSHRSCRSFKWPYPTVCLKHVVLELRISITHFILGAYRLPSSFWYFLGIRGVNFRAQILRHKEKTNLFRQVLLCAHIFFVIFVLCT